MIPLESSFIIIVVVVDFVVVVDLTKMMQPVY